MGGQVDRCKQGAEKLTIANMYFIALLAGPFASMLVITTPITTMLYNARASFNRIAVVTMMLEYYFVPWALWLCDHHHSPNRTCICADPNSSCRNAPEPLTRALEVLKMLLGMHSLLPAGLCCYCTSARTLAFVACSWAVTWSCALARWYHCCPRSRYCYHYSLSYSALSEVFVKYALLSNLAKMPHH